jgi:lipopolysaccharide biosynthesis glycosyltransferase
MKNAIAVCATPNWLAPAAVTLLSCARHGAEAYAKLIIICPSPSSEDKSNLAAFNAHHSVNIEMKDAAPTVLNRIESGHLGIGALLRLKLNEYLSPDYERVLYLDCDVLAEVSVEQLLNVNMSGHQIAAVESIAMMQIVNGSAEAHRRSLNIPPKRPYFNSGVILFDWQKTLQNSLLPRCVEILQTRTNWRFHDQDTMNIAVGGDWKALDHKWNVTKKTSDYLSLKPALRHFNGPAKPWNTRKNFSVSQYRNYYVSALAETPWSNFTDQAQKSAKLKDRWRTLARRLSYGTKANLKKHISSVAEPA